MINYSPFNCEYNKKKMIQYPDKERIIELLSKVHSKGVPNWTTKEQNDAYLEFQSLALYFFRTEDVINE